MRQLRFRGKSVDSLGKWVYSSEIKQNENIFIGGVQVEPDSVGQSTGTFDSTNTEIFENDIVSGLEYSDFLAGIDKECKSVVRWIDDYAAFMFDCGANYYRDLRDSSNVTIIGNSFDNPELDWSKNVSK